MAQGWFTNNVSHTITFLEAPPAGASNVVVKEYSANAVGGTDAFALGAWSTEYGWPSEVEFFSDRLWFAGTPRDPQTVWGSQTGDYSNFGKSTPMVDSDAITYTINARQVNAVTDLIPLDKLLVLTRGGEFLMTGGADEVVTPSSIAIKPQSYRGTAGLQAKVVGDTAIFVQEQGQRVYDIGYRFEQDGYRPQDISVWAEHLIEGRTILQMEWMPAPWSCLWFVRDNGTAIGCTYMPEQEVIGWHRHDTGLALDGTGTDRVLDWASLPDTTETETYILTSRVIDGVTKQYIETMAPSLVTDIRDWFYVDCGLTYDGRNTGAGTITLSGGTTWEETETLTLTSSAAVFVGASDVGDGFKLSRTVQEVDPGSGRTIDVTYTVDVLIAAYVSPTVVEVNSVGTVPAALRGVALTDWVLLRDTIAGLDHLEGREVRILSDASVHPARTVTGGQVSLDYPGGVVHVGLGYPAQLETLEVNSPGGSPIRDSKKLLYGVSLLVKGTRGIQVGPNIDQLEEIPQREFENWGEPTLPATGLIKLDSLPSQWGENLGVFTVVSEDPLPCEILALIPKLMASD